MCETRLQLLEVTVKGIRSRGFVRITLVLDTVLSGFECNEVFVTSDKGRIRMLWLHVQLG